MNEKIYAAIDANINRAQEGIRVCEDIMRFYYSSGFASDFKEIRHNLKKNASGFPADKLINCRDVSGDGQKFSDLESEKKRDTLQDIFKANLHRATEAVRCLEEFSKYTGDVESGAFQAVRFSLYSLERRAVGLMTKADLIDKIFSGIYAVLEVSVMGDEEAVETANGLIEGGASCIQLNLDGLSVKRALSVSERIRLICVERGILFFVNRLDVFIASSADGLLLKKTDIPISLIEKSIPPGTITGLEISEHYNTQEINTDCIDFLLIDLPAGFGSDEILEEIQKTDRPCFISGWLKSGGLIESVNMHVYPAVRMSEPGRKRAEEECIKNMEAWKDYNLK